ncbi:hypothetical protein WL77_18140 [Burkholderia ubonensis]|nr:hypothetical protein WL77_18140 [Burkholderia ubonensis]
MQDSCFRVTCIKQEMAAVTLSPLIRTYGHEQLFLTRELEINVSWKEAKSILLSISCFSNSL